MPAKRKLKATFEVTAVRDVEDGPPEVHGKLIDLIDFDLLGTDIGQRFTVELVPLEPTNDAEPVEEPSEFGEDIGG